MNLEEMQAQIDSTEYWDLDILDLEIKYFGDEISMFIYNDDETVWKLTFFTCLKVSYETDATWRGFSHVKDMRDAQFGYYGQDITISKDQEHDSFFNVKMDLTIMNVEITFQDMLLEKIPRDSISLFYAE